MKANRSDHRLFHTISLDFQARPNQRDRDAVSCDNFNMEESPGLHYLHPSSRRTSTKRRPNLVINDTNGLIINGSLFDKQLFQPSQGSCVLDYSKTPKELGRFLDTHKTPTKSAHVDSHLFKLAFVVTLSEWQVDKELLIDFCPRDDEQKPVIDEISHYKRFCFPELNTKAENGGSLVDEPSTYVFTRTSSKGQVEYGYCRRITHADSQITDFPIVICLVSTHPYFKLYDAILHELSTVFIHNEHECSVLIQSFYSKPLPLPSVHSSSVVCKLNYYRVLYYTCPYDDRLNHDYFYTLLSSLSPNFIVYLMEAMLRSKKILCFSNSLSKLTKCCLALSFLTYPFMWPYPFVSVMPSSWMQDLVDSPCPYIYGCLYETMKLLPSTIENDFVRVDLDLNTIDIGLDDGTVLPLDLQQTLQASIEYTIRFRLGKSNAMLINIAVSEACLRVFTELLYRLPDFFKRDQAKFDPSHDTRTFSVCSNYFRNDTHSTDTVEPNDPQQSSMKSESRQKDESRLGYDFRSDEFLILQPTPAYVTFLNDFIHGMIFLKFLDDYQRVDDNPKQVFSLFTQRLEERRRMSTEDQAVNPVIRFRQTFDLLEKQINQAAKSSTPLISKLVSKLFE